LVPWFGNRRNAQLRSEFATDDAAPLKFPDGFLWGAATSDHQIEHSQNDDWTAFEREVLSQQHFDSLGRGVAKPGHIRNLGHYGAEIVNKKNDHDARIEDDIALAASMKHNAYRFSISWARLFPTESQREPDAAALAFYDRVFAALDKHHVTPLVTLFHF